MRTPNSGSWKGGRDLHKTMMTHSFKARVSSTRATILAESIPNLQIVCKIIPIQVILRFSALTILMAELYAAIPQPREI